ncbi:MAG: hypothetical protein ACOYXW_12495, partial [Actinomycetota bacterium]
MDFWEVLKVVVRRWVISAPVLLLTGVAAVLVPPQIDPSYSASASTVVITPADGETALNPYLALGPVTMAQAMGLSADGEAAKQQVAAAGNSTDYAVVQQTSRSPILVVQAEAADPDQVVATVQQVLSIIEAQLKEQQDAAFAPPAMQYTVEHLTTRVGATPVYDGARQVRFLTIGIGLALAVTLALAVEGVAVLRSHRRRERAAGDASDRLAIIDARLAILDEREALLLEQSRLSEARERAAGRAGGSGEDAVTKSWRQHLATR